MPEGPTTTMSRSTWIAAAVLVLAGAVTYSAFHISPEKLGEEILAAILEVLIGVFAVSVLLERNRRQAEARTKKEELIRALYEVWREFDTARVLISTHRSAKTWREQVMLLINRLDEPLSTIKEGIRNLGEGGATRRQDDIGRFVDEARGLLRSLRDEYRTGYPAAAAKQESFEDKKKIGPAPSVDAHWSEILSDLSTTKRLIDDKAVVDNLKEAAAMLRREVLGLA